MAVNQSRVARPASNSLRGKARWRWIAAMFVLSLLGGTSCSSDNSAKISGLVTLDGQPVGLGTISLKPTDGKGPTAEAIITDGRYSLTTLPGPKKIAIHGFRKTGTRRYHEGDPSSPMVDVNEETVPTRYHEGGELTADIGAGQQTRDFALKSQ